MHDLPNNLLQVSLLLKQVIDDLQERLKHQQESRSQPLTERSRNSLHISNVVMSVIITDRYSEDGVTGLLLATKVKVSSSKGEPM